MLGFKSFMVGHYIKYFYMKLLYLFFVSYFLLNKINAQDKIFLRNDSILSGKIIYVDSVKVKIRLADRPDGPNYTLYKKEITEIVFASGQNLFFKHKYFENSFGISGSLYCNMPVEYRMLFTYMKINSKYLGFNYQVRNAFVGMKIGIGYGTLNKITEKTIWYSIHHGTIYEDVIDTINKSILNLTFSFRIHGTANRKINPFLSGTLITQDVASILLYGFGFQFRINKTYFIETEFAKGKWYGSHPKYYDYGSELTYFNFGINRILSRKYRNGK
jgi:hypothetical protein